jgi:hypothetical protein
MSQIMLYLGYLWAKFKKLLDTYYPNKKNYLDNLMLLSLYGM